MLSRSFLTLGFLIFFARTAKAITLSPGDIDYTTSGDITISGVGINSTLVGTSSSLNKIKNTFTITAGPASRAYGIKVTGNYNQITNFTGAAILTTGNSGRGISIVNNATVINQGSISTQGTTSYGIYAGGNNNTISSSGSISTINTTSYGIYLNGDSNSAVNSGSISTKVYAIYGNGNENQITNNGTINTSVSSSAHGIFVSAGTSSTASISSFTSVNNSGTINSSGNGIYVKDNYTSITNSGAITTASSSSIYAIRNEGDNSTISNSGSLTSTNYAIYNSGANVVIKNSGAVSGAVEIGGGTLNIFGGTISGAVNSSSGAGNINVGSLAHPDIIFNQNAAFANINDLTITSESTLNSAAEISANRILVDADSVLTFLSGSSINADIQGVSDSVGVVNISGAALEVENSIGISGKSLGNLNINSGASLTATNDIYATSISLGGNLIYSESDNLTIFGSLAGSGSGTINIGSKNQTIAGNFSLNSGDSLAVALKNNGAGELTVRDAAVINANSKLAISTSSDQGYIANGMRYAILKAASGSIAPISASNISVNGKDSNIYGLLKFGSSATSDSLILTIDRLSAAEVTKNKNAQNIYQNLSDIGASSSGKLLDFQEYLENSVFSGEVLAKTLNQLAPQSTKAALATTNNVVSNSITIIEDRLEKVNLQKANRVLKNSLWIQGFGGALMQKEIADDDGYNANSVGIAFGRDGEFWNKIRVGASLSLAKSSIKDLDGHKKNLIDTYQANIYGSKNSGKFFIDGVAGLALNQFNSERSILAVDANASAKYFGQTYAVKIKSGMVNDLQNGFRLTPEVSLNFLHNNISGYSEKGADELNLNVGGVSANFLEGRIGLNLGYSSEVFRELPEFQKFAGTLKISYGQAFINDAPATQASFVNQKTNFISQISHLDNSSLKLGAEVFAYHKDNTNLSADYTFERKATADSHFILLKIREEF